MATEILHVTVDDMNRQVLGVHATAEEARKFCGSPAVLGRPSVQFGDLASFGQSIVMAVEVEFSGERFRLLFGTPKFLPSSPGDAVELVPDDDGTTAYDEHAGLPRVIRTDRATAIREMLQHNRNVLDGGSPTLWAVIGEVSEPIHVSGMTTATLTGDLGFDETPLVRLSRLVHPTAAEIEAALNQIPAT